MKKIVSLLSAAAMMTMLAVPASAALTYAPDGDGWYVIESAPTDAEVAAYAPTLSATATKLESEDALKAVSTTVNKKFKSKLTTHDIYKITCDMAGIGTFINAYDGDYNNAFFGLYDITIGFNPAGLPEGFETYALTYTLPDGSTGAVGVGVSSVNGNLQAAYTAAGVAYDTIFPARTNDEGIVVDAGTYKAEFILAYPKTDEVVTIPHALTKITYKTTVGSQNSAPATTNITCDDIVLGAVEEPEEPEEPEVPADVTMDETAYSKDAAYNPNGEKTFGFKGTMNKAARYVNLAFEGAKVNVVLDFGETKIDATKTFGLNIMQVPKDVSIKAPTATAIDALTGVEGEDYILVK